MQAMSTSVILDLFWNVAVQVAGGVWEERKCEGNYNPTTGQSIGHVIQAQDHERMG